MLSFQPSIMIGAYHWNEERVPRDEFQIRRHALDAAMAVQGWSAVLIFGDAREHAALAYYTNFIPRLRWAMAILPRQGEPLLLTSNGARDMPSMKLMTWIADVRSGWEWGKHVDPYLARLEGGATATLGIVGLDLMTPTLCTQLARSLGNRFRLESAEALFPRGRTLRPREASLMRESCALVAAAAQVMRTVWQEGRDPGQAALAAERHARLAAAQDVRTLVSSDNGRSLEPNYHGDGRDEVLLGYIAVKLAGFWSELFVTASRKDSAMLDRARAAIEQAVAALRPGGELDSVFTAAAVLGSASLHPVLSGKIGWRLGLSLDEGGYIMRGNRELIAPGEIYSLHAGTRNDAGGAIASAMVAIGESGAEILCRSP
jgi:Xaa-Pro aminopeptidase